MLTISPSRSTRGPAGVPGRAARPHMALHCFKELSDHGACPAHRLDFRRRFDDDHLLLQCLCNVGEYGVDVSGSLDGPDFPGPPVVVDQGFRGLLVTYQPGPDRLLLV